MASPYVGLGLCAPEAVVTADLASGRPGMRAKKAVVVGVHRLEGVAADADGAAAAQRALELVRGAGLAGPGLAEDVYDDGALVGGDAGKEGRDNVLVEDLLVLFGAERAVGLVGPFRRAWPRVGRFGVWVLGFHRSSSGVCRGDGLRGANRSVLGKISVKSLVPPSGGTRLLRS